MANRYSFPTVGTDLRSAQDELHLFQAGDVNQGIWDTLGGPVHRCRWDSEGGANAAQLVNLGCHQGTGRDGDRWLITVVSQWLIFKHG